MGFNFLSVCVVLALVNLNSAEDPSPVSAIARSSQLFAARVYQELKAQDGNILVCPVSVQTVMALVQTGAKSETSDQIQKAMFLPQNKTETQNGFKNLMSTLRSARGVTMDIANRVFVQQGFTINPSFLEIATQSFSAEAVNVNFSEKDAASKTINNWVEEKTHDKIKDLVTPGDFNELTRMVLVNALYFNGTWKYTFDKYATHEEDFWTTPTTSVKVPMMKQTAHFKYAENTALDAKFLEMPYAGDEYAMTIVLPNKKDGLAELENKISEVMQPQQYSNERVAVTMPLFKIESTIDFVDVLRKMGMTTPFDTTADFSGLFDSNPEKIYISKIIQKNFMNVTEEGTEAASATAVNLQLRSGFPQQIEKIVADHSFIYLIKEVKTKSIVFIGRITNPNKVAAGIRSRNDFPKTEGNKNSAPTIYTSLISVLMMRIVLMLL